MLKIVETSQLIKEQTRPNSLGFCDCCILMTTYYPLVGLGGFVLKFME
jgi:hypothetical protein